MWCCPSCSYSLPDVLTAVGSSKKAAKKAAAEKMVAKLQSLSGCSEITWVRQIFVAHAKWPLEAAPTSFKVCVHLIFQTPKPSVRFENLRNSSAEKISLLRRNPLSIPNTDYIQMMLELSKEQGFEVTYFNIGKKTHTVLSLQLTLLLASPTGKNTRRLTWAYYWQKKTDARRWWIEIL